MPAVDRRCVLSWFLTALGASACSPTTGALERELRAPRPPDLEIESLGALVSTVGLEWLMLLRPRELLQSPELRPLLNRILKDERLDGFASATGIQLRETSELVFASYRSPSARTSTLLLVRHKGNPREFERKFRARLTSHIRRIEFGHQLTGVWGHIGRVPRGFVEVGPDVVGFEYDSDSRRGPGLIALLHAEKRLRDSPTVATDEFVTPVIRALGPAPALLVLPGPFEGELAWGARGMLGDSTGVGVSLSPIPQNSLAMQLVLRGDFSAEKSSRVLRESFLDLGKSDLGHLLGLAEPRSALEIRADLDGIELRTTLDASLLLRGLSAATTDDVREIMR